LLKQAIIMSSCERHSFSKDLRAGVLVVILGLML
jgi:hypothetical protein